MKWFLALLAGAGLVCLWRNRHDPYRHPLANICKLCNQPVDLGNISRLKKGA